MVTMFDRVYEFALVKMPTSVFTFVLSLYKRLKDSAKRSEETRAFTIRYEERWEPILRAVFAVVIVVWVVWKFFWLILFTSVLGGVIWLMLRAEEREEMKKDEQQTTFFQMREEEVMLPSLKQAEVLQREMQQRVRESEMVNARLFSDLTNIITKAIGNGGGEFNINATQMMTVQPDGTESKSTSVGVSGTFDPKRR